MLVDRLLGQHGDIVHDRTMQLLLGASAIAVLEIALVSPILERLTGVFEVSSAQVGLLVTAVAAPAIVLIPVGGVLADRYGRKPVLIGGLLLYGTGGAGIAFVTDFRIALVLRAVQGVGFAGTIPVIVTSFRDLYGGSREATAQGLRITVSGVSQAVFPAISGFVVVFAWQYPFLLYAIAIPVAIGMYWWLEEPTGPTVDGDGRAPRDDGRRAESGHERGYGRDLLALIRRREISAVLLAQMGSAVVVFAFYTYNSLVVVRVLDGSTPLAGILVAVFSLVFASTATQAGRLTDFLETPYAPLLAANACLGVGLPLFVFAPTTWIAGLSTLLLGVGTGITFPLYRSLVTGFAPDRLRGGLVSLAEALMRVSATFTPAVLGASISLLESSMTPGLALQWTLAVAGGTAGAVGACGIFVATLTSRGGTGRSPV